MATPTPTHQHQHQHQHHQHHHHHHHHHQQQHCRTRRAAASPWLLLLLLCGLALDTTTSFLLCRPPRRISRHHRLLGSTSDTPTPTYVVPGPDTSADLREFTIPTTVTAPIPLPEAVFTYGGFSSMSKARKLIRKDQVLVNQEIKNCQDAVHAGDQVQVVASEPPHKRKDGKARGAKTVRVVFEDDDMAVIVKPAGVAVHGTGAYSLVDQYDKFLVPTTRGEEEALPKPVHAHRLDAPVGGLLLVAKTKTALRALLTAFQERAIHKQYHAVVIGTPAEAMGTVTVPVDGKDALTKYKLVDSVPSPTFGTLSRVDLFPETGRKHQLRQHCSLALGTPILGDIRYGPDNTLRTRGLFLWSQAVELAHPVTGEALSFKIPLPEIYQNSMNMERNAFEKAAVAAAAQEAAAAAADAAEPDPHGVQAE